MTAVPPAVDCHQQEDLSLWVFAANERARRFYRELGFAEDGAQAVDPGTRPAAAPPPA